MNVRWTTPALVTVIAVLAIALGVKSCERPPEANIPPALQKTLDSIAAVAPVVAAHRDSVIKIVVRDTTKARIQAARADSVLRVADAARGIADSLAALARQRADSAALWHQAYDAERLAGDVVRRALASKDSAYRVEATNTIRLLGQMHLDSIWANGLASANSSLVSRIRQLEAPCRVVGPIPCPTRTQTMVATAILAVAAQNVATRR